MTSVQIFIIWIGICSSICKDSMAITVTQTGTDIKQWKVQTIGRMHCPWPLQAERRGHYRQCYPSPTARGPSTSGLCVSHKC